MNHLWTILEHLQTPEGILIFLGCIGLIFAYPSWRYYKNKLKTDKNGWIKSMNMHFHQWKEKKHANRVQKDALPYKINAEQIEDRLRKTKDFDVISRTNFKNNNKKIEISTLPDRLTITLGDFPTCQEFIPAIKYVFNLIGPKDDIRDITDTIQSLVKIDHLCPNHQANTYHPIVDSILTKTRTYSIRLDRFTTSYTSLHRLVIEMGGRTQLK